LSDFFAEIRLTFTSDLYKIECTDLILMGKYYVYIEKGNRVVINEDIL